MTSEQIKAQAEEKPKVPKFKIGDRVIVTRGKYVFCKGIIKGYSKDNAWITILDDLDYPINFDESYIEHYFNKSSKKNLLDVAKSVETSTKGDAYFAYRLDLAKEIAVAVIRSDRWDFKTCNPVEQANEIVKRLKETEI